MSTGVATMDRLAADLNNRKAVFVDDQGRLCDANEMGSRAQGNPQQSFAPGSDPVQLKPHTWSSLH